MFFHRLCMPTSHAASRRHSPKHHQHDGLLDKKELAVSSPVDAALEPDPVPAADESGMRNPDLFFFFHLDGRLASGSEASA